MRGMINVLALMLTVAGCASSGNPKLLDSAPGFSVTNNVVFEDASHQLRVATRIAYPAKGRDLPVILFSHGAYSSKDDYNAILDVWAARGYVVVAPTHRDSVSLGAVRGTNNPRSFPWRLDDMALLLAQLDSLGSKVPALAGRVATNRVAVAGHSYGGLIAQILGGGTYLDVSSGKTVSRADPRIRAVIIFSGAGRFPPLLRGEDFRSLTLPTLVTVGTEDLKQTDISGYRWRREPYDLIPAGSKYLLVIDGADHYLGGLVCRDDLPKQAQGAAYVAAFNEMSLAFLDATLRKDVSSKRRLSELLLRTAPGKPGIAHSWHNTEVGD